MQRINFTQDTLTTLKRSARCSFANAVYKLTMKAQQGLKCDDLFKKSVLMNEVNKLLCKYKLDTCISFHPALEAGISSWYFGIGSFTGLITYNLIIDGVETFIGSGSSVENIVIDINNNTEGTGVTAVLGEGGYFTIYSPAGCFIKADLTGSKDPAGSIPQTITTFTKSKCPQVETCVEYTEEELNCITPQDLQLIFEFTHRYKETLAKSTKRITSPSTSSSSSSASDCCNWGSIGGSIGNQSDLVAYLNTIKKNFIAASNESILLSNDIKSLNFLGAGVTATNSGGDISITIPGGGGGGSQTLAATLALGNISGANDIEFDVTQGLLFSNTSRFREGTIDAGLGGTKGVAQICAVGYELKWEAGRLYVMDGNGLFIRQSLYNFNIPPTVNDDSTKGYGIGSLWTLDDNTTYGCSDATIGAANWSIIINSGTLQQVLGVGNTSTTSLSIDDGAGSSVTVKSSSIDIYNTLGGQASIQSQSLTTATTFEIPNKAGGTETFAMLSDVTGDVVGPASAVDNNIATFDGTTGKLIQDGGTTIADINTNAVDRITVKLAESITKGQAVYISGANGTNILVSKASNLTEATSSKTLGLLETSGATNAIVNVITSGLIDGIDTSAATIGDAVWLGTAGNLLFGLANKPYAPAHLVYIGVVSRVSATVGEIIVKVQNGFELKEIHDVSAQTPANKNGLFYNTSTSLWEARAVAATDIDANVSNTEFGYLDGVSSAIQTQINGKQATLTNPVTGTGTNNEIAAFNSTGSTITSLAVATYPSLTELAYVKGVTSAIQTQINTKVTVFASATDGTASSGVTSTISISVLISANTFVVDDVIRINHRVRATGTAGIRETRVYANTTSSLTGAILMSTSSLGATILAANNQRYLAIKNATTNTEVVTATTSLLSDYNSVATAVSTLAINWTVDQYIIFQVNAANAGDSIRATMYSIEKL